MQEEKELTGHLMGGLGNVLFIVATCFALSKKYKVKLRFYCHPNLWRDAKRRSMQYYKMFENFEIDCANNRKSGITFREPYFFYDSITIDRRNHSCIYGYFQSYKYFDEYKCEFIKMLNNPYKDEVDHELTEQLKQVAANNESDLPPSKKIQELEFVSIHVRRTDYLALSDIHLNLDTAYYEEAISNFPQEKSVFLIFSDDVDFVQKEPLFQNLVNKHIVTNQDDEYCFWLMSACDHNIIANSSYSWWASYINSNPNKLVVSPSKWFGPKGPVYKIRDIIPETKNYKMVFVNNK
jgi:Glycosyl transferase family 11